MGKTAALEAQSTLEDRHMVGIPPREKMVSPREVLPSITFTRPLLENRGLMTGFPQLHRRGGASVQPVRRVGARTAPRGLLQVPHIQAFFAYRKEYPSKRTAWLTVMLWGWGALGGLPAPHPCAGHLWSGPALHSVRGHYRGGGGLLY